VDDLDALEGRILAAVDDLGCLGSMSQPATDADRPGWLLFFGSAADRDQAATRLDDGVLPPGWHATRVDVPDEPWAARSQAALGAVRVGRLTVAPPWGGGTEGGQVVLIEPSSGFGTGHHATTRLCLQALQALDVAGRHVIDVGSGSGVLALAAEKLGADRIVALEPDPDALDAARRNCGLNGAVRIDLVPARLEDYHGGPFDIVLANLTGASLGHSAARLMELAGRRGTLILSGFETDELDGVVETFAGRPSRRLDEDGWSGLVVSP